MFNTLKTLLQIYIQKFFVLSSSDRNNRMYNFKSNLLYVRTALKQMCILAHAEKLWQSLDEEI